MQNSPSPYFRSSIFLLSFFLIIAVIYSPALYFNYIFHDDVWFWVRLKEYGFKQVAHDKNIIIGRYAAAWLIDLQGLLVHKVSDLKFLRFLAVLLLSGNAFLLWQQMRRFSWSDIQSFLIISPMFFLPGFADSIFYTSNAYVIFSILFACWSFRKSEGSKGILIPSISFLIAILFYPSGAMFYWAMVGMYILFSNNRFDLLFRNNIFRFMAVGLIGLLTYAILLFFMHYVFSYKTTNPLYNPYVITHDWQGKLQWFFQEPIGNALNLWDIYPKVTTSIIVFIFIIFTALVVTTKKLIQIEPQKRKDISLTCLWQLALLILIFFLTFLPNLAAQGNAAFYRCLIPLTSLIWFVLIWAIFQWMDIIPRILTKWSMISLLSLIVVYAGIKTYNHVLYYRVLPSYVEWNAYKSMIQKIRFKKIDAIHIFLPFHSPIERYDEFAVLSSHYPSNIYPLIYSALMETGGLNRHSIPLVYITYPDDTVLLELKEIYFKKLPNGNVIWKDINRDNQFYEIDHSRVSSADDYGVTIFLGPQKVFSKNLNWYILDLKNLFKASHQ